MTESIISNDFFSETSDVMDNVFNSDKFEAIQFVMDFLVMIRDLSGLDLRKMNKLEFSECDLDTEFYGSYDLSLGLTI